MRCGNCMQPKHLHRTRMEAAPICANGGVSGVQSFEDGFMANVVMPDGQLLGHHVRKSIAHAYETTEILPMLPDYSS